MSAPEEKDRDLTSTHALLLLGQIHGMVQSLKEGQTRVDERLDGIDQRLRHVEQKAAVAGAVSGGAMAVGTALIIEGVKHWMRGGSGTP